MAPTSTPGSPWPPSRRAPTASGSGRWHRCHAVARGSSREAVSLDRLSGSRLVLGVGIGADHSQEYSAFGEPSDDHCAVSPRRGIGDRHAAVDGGRSHPGRHFSRRRGAVPPRASSNPASPSGAAPPAPPAPTTSAARYDGVVPIGGLRPRRSNPQRNRPAPTARPVDGRSLVDTSGTAPHEYELVTGQHAFPGTTPSRRLRGPYNGAPASRRRSWNAPEDYGRSRIKPPQAASLVPPIILVMLTRPQSSAAVPFRAAHSRSSSALSMRLRATWRYELSMRSATSPQSTRFRAPRSNASHPPGPKYAGT